MRSVLPDRNRARYRAGDEPRAFLQAEMFAWIACLFCIPAAVMFFAFGWAALAWNYYMAAGLMVGAVLIAAAGAFSVALTRALMQSARETREMLRELSDQFLN